MNQRKILITGGGGYIGSILSEKLLLEGYRVRILDKFLFGKQSIAAISNHPHLEIQTGDIRKRKDLQLAIEKADYLVHLAGIVGDNACNLKADIAVEINYLSTLKLAHLAKNGGVKKFIFASTCSVYGASKTIILNEESATQPLSLYAETKLKAEKGLVKLFKNNSALTILRFGTAYGLSPRMRFDLVVNDLTQKAFFKKEIKIFGGQQWRPFVHTQDIVQAIILILKTPLGKTNQTIFNVGSTEENYQIKNLGKLIKKCLPKTKIQQIRDIKDQRSYRVSFEKIKKEFGFLTQKTIKDGILEIETALESGQIKDPNEPIYYNDRIIAV